ncbi:MAG: PepSY domain-containing protein [Armatimonadota bacterium]|nr:PepSY domain-containing protein [Armatimonadota bacterium]
MKTKTIKAILWCACLSIVGLQGGWSQKPTLQQPPERVIKEALRFAEGRKFSFRRKIKSAWQECYVFIGDNVHIEVDAVTEKVTFALYSEPHPLISKEKLTDIDKIEKRVKFWLKEKGIDLRSWNLEEKKVIGERIFFNWAKRSPKGVRLPCVLSVNVWVSAEGIGIGSISWIERELEVSLEPTVKEEEAIKIATEAAKFSQARVVGRDLYVWFNEEGRQELWWEVTLEENKIRKTVVINAHTGKVRAIYHYK